MKRIAFGCFAILVFAGCDNSPTVPTASDQLVMAAAAADSGGLPFREVTAGEFFSCALNARGDTFCWGINAFGTLGAGDRTDAATPRRVLGDAAFASISSAGSHACGLTHNGEVWCWGLNSSGEAGAQTGDTCPSATGAQLDCALVPAQIPGDIRFKSIDAGHRHNCGLTVHGEAFCWGWNQFAQLGAVSTETCGVTPCSRTPLPVPGGLRFKSISAGFWQTCGIADDDLTYCWGNNQLGALGIGTAGGVFPTPTLSASGMVFDKLSSGSSATCAITPAGITMCWGLPNSAGELGDGTNIAHLTPQPIAGDFINVDAINASTENNFLAHVCGITRTGDAECWGSDRRGQLGAVTTQICLFAGIVFDCSNVPLAVVGGFTFEAIAPGNEHSCGVTKGGDVFCWGRNERGQVGDGTTVDKPTPVAVAFP